MAEWKDVHPVSRKSVLEVDLDIEIKSRGRICFVKNAIEFRRSVKTCETFYR